MQHSLDQSPGRSLFLSFVFLTQIPAKLFCFDAHRKSYNHWWEDWVTNGELILSIKLKYGDGEFLRTTRNTTAAMLMTNILTLRNSPSAAYDKRGNLASHTVCQGIFAIACKGRISANSYEIISTSPAAGLHPLVGSHRDSLALVFIHEAILWKS